MHYFNCWVNFVLVNFNCLMFILHSVAKLFLWHIMCNIHYKFCFKNRNGAALISLQTKAQYVIYALIHLRTEQQSAVMYFCASVYRFSLKAVQCQKPKLQLLSPLVMFAQ